MADNGTVTPEGDIIVHNKGAFTYTLQFKDDAGNEKDVSARSYYFVSSTGLRIMLTTGSKNSEKILVIPQEALRVALKLVTEFAVVDETDALHVIEWSGRLQVRGW